MEEKKKKIEKKIVDCILCNCQTSDYYRIPTNKGYVHKCANCYELWVLRETRQATGSNAGKTNGVVE